MFFRFLVNGGNMGKEVESRMLVDEKTKKRLKTANLILPLSTTIMIITYIYLLVRRWILIIDASLEAYGPGGFLDRNVLLTNKDILANFTKVFDSLQVVALCGILITFILILISSMDKNRKYLIAIVINFSAIIIMRLVRVIIIHRSPENIFLIGSVNPFPTAYYDYAFLIYSTDILRMVITLLLIISAILFVIYLQQTINQKFKFCFTAPIILGVSLVLYIFTIVSSGIFEYSLDSNTAVIMYYVHYVSQTFLQIGNILVYYCLGRKKKLLGT